MNNIYKQIDKERLHWQKKTCKKNVLNAEMSSMNESVASGGCILCQARNIIVVIGADLNL